MTPIVNIPWEGNQMFEPILDKDKIVWYQMPQKIMKTRVALEHIQCIEY